MRSALLLIVLAVPAQAQQSMTAAEFEAYAEGKTLSYSHTGLPPYGTERYMANRRVIWTTIDGRCTTGIWFDSKDKICFRYEDDPTYKCWNFYADGDQLIGYFEGETAVPYLIDIIDDNDLFQCNQLSS